jgi:hypothetical protein
MLTAAAAFCFGSAASAAELPTKAPVYKAPPLVSVWDTEVGLRYMYSSGKMQYDLKAPGNTSQLNSRLTYTGLTANSGEAFGRFDHRPTGVFVKGYVGVGKITSGGNLRDEDFPPALNPYSSTNSNIANGTIRYGTIDLGYNLWTAPRSKLGGFVGYNYFYETATAFGCTQNAGNPNICVPSIASGVQVLSLTGKWQAMRVGLAGQAMLTDRIKLSAEAAYLPYVSLSGYDNHWLRPNINPLPQGGRG